jgi:hypothetical protein
MATCRFTIALLLAAGCAPRCPSSAPRSGDSCDPRLNGLACAYSDRVCECVGGSREAEWLCAASSVDMRSDPCPSSGTVDGVSPDCRCPPRSAGASVDGQPCSSPEIACFFNSRDQCSCTDGLWRCARSEAGLGCPLAPAPGGSCGDGMAQCLYSSVFCACDVSRLWRCTALTGDGGAHD